MLLAPDADSTQTTAARSLVVATAGAAEAPSVEVSLTGEEASGPGQTHAPAAQVRPGARAVVQLPQCVTSLGRS